MRRLARKLPPPDEWHAAAGDSLKKRGQTPFLHVSPGAPWVVSEFSPKEDRTITLTTEATDGAHARRDARSEAGGVTFS